jgi:hypothetical protein
MLRPKFPRFIRRMAELGYQDLRSDLAQSHLLLILLQARPAFLRHDALEHHLRDILAIRPMSCLSWRSHATNNQMPSGEEIEDARWW